MKERVKGFIVNLMPKSLVNFIGQTYTSTDTFSYRNLSYSQEGEDLILNRLMEGKEKGFYIDIGAHHPLRFSNTYSFYIRGWRGINIDAMPGSMNIFSELRSEDINLEIPISDEEKIIKYHIFSDHAFNTLSPITAKKHMDESKAMLVEEKQLLCVTLDNVLNKYLPKGKEIDFMSIDVEGYELHVLKSNNWAKFKPLYIVIEIYSILIEQIYDMDIHKYLSNLNYKLVSRTPNTSIYKSISQHNKM